MPVFIVVFSAYETGFLIRGFGSLCNLGLSKTLRFSLQRHKTREFGEAEFSDCLPVFALVCVFAFDTGGLGFWQPLQPRYSKGTAFFSGKAQKRKAAKLNNHLTDKVCTDFIFNLREGYS